MNTTTVKIIVALLALFAVVTISAQIYMSLQSGYETTTAYSAVVEDKISGVGVFLRDETVIEYSGGGVVSYPYADGSRIARNSAAAYIYQSESDIVSGNKLAALDSEIALLEKVQNPGTTEVAQPEFISRLIEEKYITVSECIAGNDLERLEKERRELLELLCISKIATGKEKNYNERLDTLKTQRETLAGSAGAPLDTISVSEPGYFVSHTDGYESELTTAFASDITATVIKNIVENPEKTVISTQVGKVISGYRWKFAAVADNSENRILAGTKVTLSFPSSGERVEAAVEDVRPTDDPKESVIILSADRLDYNLVQHRTEKADIVFGTVSGIKVPRAAIRFRNGEKGVYILVGESVEFKKLDVVYDGEDFIISRSDAGNGYISLYDGVITEGIKPDDEKMLAISEEAAAKESSENSESSEKDESSTSSGTDSESSGS